MGYNTTVVVRNDALEDIEKDKGFGKKLSEGVRRVFKPPYWIVEIPAGSHANAIQVVESHHADLMEVIAVGGNLGRRLGPGGNYRATNEEILHRLADEMGYCLVPKSRR